MEELYVVLTFVSGIKLKLNNSRHHHHHHHHQGLGPIMLVPLCNEDASGLSIFILVMPEHGVRFDSTTKSVVAGGR